MSQLRVVEDLKLRNKNNMNVIAGEYFGNKYTYKQTFQMIEDYKKAFIQIDGLNENTITISAPSTIASVNAFYGAIDANKVVNMTGPGFLHAYTEKYTRDLNSQTVFIFDGFLNDEIIIKLHQAGVKNVIITTVKDYMNPFIKYIAEKKGVVSSSDFADEYIKRNGSFPKGMQIIRLREFAKAGREVKEKYDFPYIEKRIAAYFLTGATTSQFPKCVKLYEDGITRMASIYDQMWFDFGVGDRNTVFIPLFYATGAIHGVHAGLISGATNIYKPKYDRFAFGQDLKQTKAKIAIVAPSHVATLDESGLKDNSLKHVKYIFVGGEAIMPAQMEKFRKTADRLGIQYVLNGYGMTETGSMSGVSEKDAQNGDVEVVPVPGVEYRIVSESTGDILPDNQRGILQKKSPCATAGYFEEEKNKVLFTEDGWINTGDIAIRDSNGKYRVFRRSTDSFKNNSITYAMYDIEEQVLKHPGVAEAEVIKFGTKGNERPAIVVVMRNDCKDNLADIVRDLCSIEVSGIEHLLGVKFVNKFKTNPVTSKRDYLSLQDDKSDYFYVDKDGFYYCVDAVGNSVKINSDNLFIKEND